MLSASRPFMALAVILALSALPSSRAADDFKLEEGYTLLFNGKDLTGWEHGYCPPGTRPNDEKLDGKTISKDKVFEVSDGLLVASGKALRAVYTSREYNKPFHLKFEFRTPADNKKNNSGLFLRGPQLQLDGTNVGGLTNVFKNIKNFKEGDWNEIDVTVNAAAVSNTVNGKALTEKDALELTIKDGKPTAKLNGQPIDVLSFQHSEGAEATCKCNGELIGKPMKIPATGTIGLQSEIGKFEFRRIRIKELP
jgi:Domain of Unknown Function (DUF1080)